MEIVKEQSLGGYCTVDYLNIDQESNLYFNSHLKVNTDFSYRIEIRLKEDEFRERGLEILGYLPLNLKVAIQKLVLGLPTNEMQGLMNEINSSSQEHIEVTLLSFNNVKENVNSEMNGALKEVSDIEYSPFSKDINVLTFLIKWMMDLSKVKNRFVKNGIKHYKLNALLEKKKIFKEFSDSIQFSDNELCTLSYLERGQRLKSYFGYIQINKDLTYKADFESYTRLKKYTYSFSGFIPAHLEDGFNKLYNSPIVLGMVTQDIVHHGTSADEYFHFCFKNMHRPDEIIQAKLSLSVGVIKQTYNIVPDDNIEDFFTSLGSQFIDFMLRICDEKDLFLNKGIRSIRIEG